MSLPIYHPQFNRSLARSDVAVILVAGPTIISRWLAVVALIGEKSGLRYINSNVTSITNFSPVKYLNVTCRAKIQAIITSRKELVGLHFCLVVQRYLPDITCNILAIPRKKSNLLDLYNFTYQYPDAEHVSNDPRNNLTQFRDISNTSVLYNRVEILLDAKSKVEVQAVMSNNTHYLKHQYIVQTAIRSCSTHIIAGIRSIGNLTYSRDQFINVDSDLNKGGLFYGLASRVISLFGSFLEVFVGKALLDIRGRLNPGKSLFMMGTIVTDTDKTLVMPSNLLSHLQRVLQVTLLLAKLGTLEQEALNVIMFVADKRNIIVYEIDKPQIIVTIAVLLIIGLGYLVYLSLYSSRAYGRLIRDSLVYSLTVAGLYSPTIKGACLASLDEILDKAGD